MKPVKAALVFDDGGPFLMRGGERVSHRLETLETVHELGIINPVEYEAGQVFRSLWEAVEGSQEPRYEQHFGGSSDGDLTDGAAEALGHLTDIRRAFQSREAYGLCIAVVKSTEFRTSKRYRPGDIQAAFSALANVIGELRIWC